MDLFEAIHTRQSINKVKPEPVSRQLIEKMLAAAVQAPNHYKVRPWRFFVLTGAALERFADVTVSAFRKRMPGAANDAAEAQRPKALRSSVLIVVGVDKPGESKVIEIENVCATAAAVQNLLLAARGLGLATKWNTGDNATDDSIKAFFGLAPDQHLLGFFHIGYPMAEAQSVERPSFEDRTVWME